MRVPGFMLQQEVTVTPYLGPNPYGNTHGDPYTLRCRIEARNELVRDSSGNETVSSAKMYTFPEAEVHVQDIVSWADHEYDVIDVAPEAGPGGQTHHKEVVLR